MNDREKLVELLAQSCEWRAKHCVGCKDDLPCAAECREEKFGRVADHMIANGVTVQNWISVEDRLPENGVEVLVCDRHSNVFVATICNSEYFSSGLTWRDQTGYMLGSLGITHWMPLPEQPKEEE